MKTLLTFALLAAGCSTPIDGTPFTLGYLNGPMISVLADRSIDPTHDTLGEELLQIREKGPRQHPNLEDFRYVVLSKESLVVMVAAKYRDPAPIIKYLNEAKERTTKVRSITGEIVTAWTNEGSGEIFVVDNKELRLVSPALFRLIYGDV